MHEKYRPSWGFLWVFPMKPNQALITALKDPNLSLKAKGLLSILLLVEEELTARELSQLSRDGIDAVRNGLRELIEQGWLQRKLIVREGKPPRWQNRVRHG
jgi:hypothetical protein